MNEINSDKYKSQLDMEVEVMRAAGIEDNEIIRLASLRRKVAVGDCSEVTDEHKRMVFCRYLIENSQITDELPDSEQEPLISLPAKPSGHPNF